MIVQNGDPVLRAHAQEVPTSEISSPRIKKVIEHMKKTLATQDDGVALAAPQIGESLRIFIVSHLVYQRYDKENKPITPILSLKDDRVFINPRIVKTSKKREWLEEGCLSCRWWYGYVYRSKQVTIEAYNEKGEKVSVGAGGLLAQIFQHEIDHLDGILFLDKAEDLKEVNPKDLEHERL